MDVWPSLYISTVLKINLKGEVCHQIFEQPSIWAKPIPSFRATGPVNLLSTGWKMALLDACQDPEHRIVCGILFFNHITHPLWVMALHIPLYLSPFKAALPLFGIFLSGPRTCNILFFWFYLMRNSFPEHQIFPSHVPGGKMDKYKWETLSSPYTLKPVGLFSCLFCCLKSTFSTPIHRMVKLLPPQTPSQISISSGTPCSPFPIRINDYSSMPSCSHPSTSKTAWYIGL